MEMREDFASVLFEPLPSSLEDHPALRGHHIEPPIQAVKKGRYRKKEDSPGYFTIRIIMLILWSLPALASMSPKIREESSRLRKNSSSYSPDDFLYEDIPGLNSSWPEGLQRSPRQTHLHRNDMENGSVVLADRKSKLIHHSGSGSEEEEQTTRQPFGEHCECWNFSDGHIREVECLCKQLTVNMTLPQEIHRITVEDSPTFTTLANEQIRPFSSSLLEIILVELPEFAHIKDGAFIGMRNLHTIYLMGAPSLTNISHSVFKGFFPKLKNIKIVHTGLEVTPMFNQLMTNTHLDSVDLENNKISRIEPRWVEKLKVEHLTLSYNNLRSIGPSAFEGATIARLTLKGNHQLTGLHPNAFAGIESLRQLDLSDTAITFLPTYGLKHLEILRLQRTPSLTVIPSIYHFESLKEAAMTYPYHCCAFANPETHDPVEYKKFQEFVEKVKANKCEGTTTMAPMEDEFSTSVEFAGTVVMRRRRRQIFDAPDLSSKDSIKGKNEYESLWNNPTALSSELDSGNTESFTEGHADDGGFHDPYYVFDPDKSFTPLDNRQGQEKISSWETDLSERNQLTDFGTFHPASVTLAPQVIQLCGNVAVKKTPVVKCTPEPDAFSPCEDIMGNMWLRVAVWVVVTLALVGNMAVLVVLILTPGRMSVQRFLMANLSFADLCMGIYMLMVAVEDLVSLGVYFNFAIDWQLGWGCQLAGFLTVFAAELSVFTLAVITGERWYALTRAIHLTKRLTIKGAAKLMAFGWVLAISLALLPLVGVSSYSKTSICLPMEGSYTTAQVYLAFMLLFNGLAFTMVAYAYFQMYRTVAGHSTTGAPATHSADLAIAKKMGLLVFTDFVCWAPVAFFGLTAVAGHPLIDVTDAKILLVFFYPLNSFCNPYLYAILTKQYRRDLFLLLHRHGMCTNTMARYRSTAASTNNTVPTMQTMMRIGSVSVTDNARHNSGRISVTSVSADHVHPANSIGVTRLGEGSDLQSSLSSAPVKNHGSKLSNDRHHHHSIHFDSTDGDRENSIDERTQAETSFIAIPLSEHQDNKGKTSKPSGRLRNDSRVAILPPIKDSTDDHEISEITPFCTTAES